MARDMVDISELEEARALPTQKKALVVESEPTMRDAVARLLYELDFITWAVADLETALALVGDIEFDLALIGLNLVRECDSLRFAQFLRATYPEIGIILMVERGYEITAGVEDFVLYSKPGRERPTWLRWPSPCRPLP
jgi:CheY-like chemotaxis protein